jgi:hypothetical protein
MDWDTRMKVELGSLAVIAALAAGGAQAQAPMTAKEQWACEVALCMANPQGPMAAPACVAPIRKMLREQAKGHVIPKCKFTGGSGGGSGGGRPGVPERLAQRK